MEVRSVERAVGAEESPGLLALAVIGLDDPYPGDRLLQRGEVLAHLVAHVEIRLVRLTLEPHRRCNHHGQDEHHGQQQLPTDGRHHHQGDHQQQNRADELEQTPLDELGHALDVGGHAGHQHARLVAVEERHRLRLQPVEHPHPQVAQEAFTRLVDGEVLQARGDVADTHHHQVGDDAQVQHLRVGVEQAVVGGDEHQHRAGHGAQGDDGDIGDGLPHRGAIRRGELERPAHHVAGLVPVEAVLVAHHGAVHLTPPPSRWAGRRRRPRLRARRAPRGSAGSMPATRRGCRWPPLARRRRAPRDRPGRWCRRDGR